METPINDKSAENPITDFDNDIPIPILDNEQELDQAKKILSLAKSGINSAPHQTTGFHGVSIESINILIQYGNLPGNSLPSHPNPDLPQKGDLYYIANKNNASFGEAAKYAADNAEKYFLADKLGLRINNRDDKELVLNLSLYPDEVWAIEELERYVKKSGIKKEYLQELIQKARTRKGLVIGLKPSIADFFQETYGDDRRIGDSRINLPDGLKTEFISGIEIIGPEASKYFQKLEEAISKYTN